MSDEAQSLGFSDGYMKIGADMRNLILTAKTDENMVQMYIFGESEESRTTFLEEHTQELRQAMGNSKLSFAIQVDEPPSLKLRKYSQMPSKKSIISDVYSFEISSILKYLHESLGGNLYYL